MKKIIIFLFLGLLGSGLNHLKAQGSCNFLVGESVTFSASGATAGVNQRYLLTDTLGVIKYATTTLPISGVVAGRYKAYSLAYDNVGTAPNLTVGNTISSLGGTACTALSEPLPLGVCACNATGSLSFQISGGSTGVNVTQIYVLTNKRFEIISTHSTSPIAAPADGIYNVFSILYDNTLTPPTLTAGTSIYDIGGSCVAKSQPIGFVSCTPCDTTLTVSNTTICEGLSVNLFPLASGVKGTLTYSTNGTTWSALANPTNVTPSVSTAYFVKDSLSANCLDIDTLTITVTPKPNAGVDQTLACSGGTVVTTGNLAAVTAGGVWTQATTNPAGATITDANSATTSVSGLAIGSYEFIWTVSNCVDTVKVTVQGCATFDLALRKTVVSPSDLVVHENDVVTFKMVVYNQGAADAYEVKVIDYVPVNLQFNVADNTAATTGNTNNWLADKTYTIGSIAAGDSATVFVKLKAVPTSAVKPETFINVAEIAFASYTLGGTSNALDADSQADTNGTNDVVKGDNKILNENGDEDDHDFAWVNYNGLYDPEGFLYCDISGKLVTGGQVAVQTPPGGIAYIIKDGTDGQYQFYTNNVAGVYTISYTHPNSFPMSTSCLQQAGAFDPTSTDGTAVDKDGVVNGVVRLGTFTVTNGYLADITCSANPFYMSFDLAAGDPEIFNNNLPIRCMMPDLSVGINILDTCRFVGEQTTVRIVVKNTGIIAATGVVVTDSIPAGFCNIVATPSVGTFDTLTGRWLIPSIAIGDSAVLTYTAKMKAIGGVSIVKAEVTAMNEIDIDSEPNNHVLTEDDIAQDCITVPITICAGQTVTANAPSNFTTIQWFRNGQAIAGANANTLSIRQIGNYTVTATEQTCPANGCCPIKVIEGDCCKPVICLPVMVQRQ